MTFGSAENFAIVKNTEKINVAENVNTGLPRMQKPSSTVFNCSYLCPIRGLILI